MKQFDELADPGGQPVDGGFSAELKNQRIFIQCTWANAYAEPVRNKGLCIQSYDRRMLYHLYFNVYQYYKQEKRYERKIYDPILQNQIGIATGNYKTDGIGIYWIEVQLYYSNRMEKGWMRETDIWFPAKGEKPNPADWHHLGYKPETGEINIPDTGETKSTSKIVAWLTGGLTILSFLR